MVCDNLEDSVLVYIIESNRSFNSILRGYAYKMLRYFTVALKRQADAVGRQSSSNNVSDTISRHIYWACDALWRLNIVDTGIVQRG